MVRVKVYVIAFQIGTVWHGPEEGTRSGVFLTQTVTS
jgi:hypothetical protein